MSLLFGWVPTDLTSGVASVLSEMEAALRADAGQQCDMTVLPGVGVGVLEPRALEGRSEDLRPARSADGRFTLWMAGEAVGSGDPGLPMTDVAGSRLPVFRRALLDRWLEVGIRAIATLDGDFQIAIWDSRTRMLTVVNDRLGGLPLYWSHAGEGTAFGGGVRGVLMAPGVSPGPDVTALREALTFGGFRLGDRTNVESVRMMPGGSVASIRPDGCRVSRYWNWTDIPSQPARSYPELIEELQRLWNRSIDRCLAGPGRVGQTLSGGLDSRAILAEGARRHRNWIAVTYGLPGCDDAKYARRAAEAVRADWRFYPLYGGADPDWLDRRTHFIQQTDGLIQLGDLMHLEALDLQRSCFDVHVSGYIGDAVSGPTFANVNDVDAVVLSLPYYETPLGLSYDGSVARVRELASGPNGASPRYFLFDHKLPQSTNRWTAAWRPWLRVRKPFVDHAFLDFCLGLPLDVRTTGRLHERWLRASYPECFATIPNQKSGVPVLASAWRHQAARVLRHGISVVGGLLPDLWRPAARVRAYHDDDRVWRQPPFIDRILDPLLDPASLTAETLGRQPVVTLLAKWRAHASAPAQLIGALYVYELYHRNLAATLRRARLRAARPAPAAVGNL